MNSRSALSVIGILAVIGVGFLAPPISQSADPEPLAGPSLKNECVKAGLVLPKVFTARMLHPGRRHNPRIQQVSIKVRFEALPAECSGKFRRLSHVKAQIQNPKKRARWFNLDPGLKWRLLFYSGNKSGEGGANITSNGHEGPNVFYRCSKGKRKTGARAIYRNQVKDLSTGRIVGQRIKKRRIKVDGGGC